VAIKIRICIFTDAGMNFWGLIFGVKDYRFERTICLIPQNDANELYPVVKMEVTSKFVYVVSGLWIYVYTLDGEFHYAWRDKYDPCPWNSLLFVGENLVWTSNSSEIKVWNFDASGPSVSLVDQIEFSAAPIQMMYKFPSVLDKENSLVWVGFLDQTVVLYDASSRRPVRKIILNEKAHEVCKFMLSLGSMMLLATLRLQTNAANLLWFQSVWLV
jgi:hypothetical protein